MDAFFGFLPARGAHFGNIVGPFAISFQCMFPMLLYLRYMFIGIFGVFCTPVFFQAPGCILDSICFILQEIACIVVKLWEQIVTKERHFLGPAPKVLIFRVVEKICCTT